MSAIFSFWNCDAPFPIVELSFQIVDEDNNPVANEYIEASISSSGVIRGGYTDDSGYVVNKFPKDELIQLSIGNTYANCSFQNYSLNENIGPFQQDTDLGILNATIIGDGIVQIQGTIDALCTNGNDEGYYVIIESNDDSSCHWVFYIDNGSWNVQFQGNSLDSYTAKLYDVVNYTASDEYTLTNGLNDLGVVSVCDITGEYVKLQLEGEEEIDFVVISEGELIHDPVSSEISMLDSTLLLTSFNSQRSIKISFIINYTDELDKLNTSSLSYLDFNYSSVENSIGGIYCDNDSINLDLCNAQVLTLSEFGDSEGYLSGTMSGVMEGTASFGYTMDFRFKID